VAGANGTTEYRKRTRRETNGVDRTRSQIQRAEGAVTRQSVAVQISDEVPAATVASLQESVAAAAGIEEGRDQLSVVTIPFAEDGTAKLAASGLGAEPDPATAPAPAMSRLDMIKTGAAGFGVLALALLAWRSLRRRQRGLERALPELLKSGPVSVAELGAPAVALARPKEEPMARLEGQEKTQVEAQMEDLALRRPDDVAQLIRGWLVEKR
jgi:flagellar M-ring protein FliF